MTELNPIIKMEARNLNFHYGANDALKNINVAVKERQITALIGSLKAAALWSEVSEPLHANALGLTLGQQAAPLYRPGAGRSTRGHLDG